MLAYEPDLAWVPSSIKTGPRQPGNTGGKTALMVAMNGGKGVGMAGGPGDIREGIAPPFREVSNRNPVDAVTLLLEAGADPSAKTPDGDSALHLAALEGKLDGRARPGRGRCGHEFEGLAPARPRCKSCRSRRRGRRRRRLVRRSIPSGRRSRPKSLRCCVSSRAVTRKPRIRRGSAAVRELGLHRGRSRSRGRGRRRLFLDEAVARSRARKSSWAMLDRYCVDCHNDAELTADLSFEGRGPDDVHSDPAVWEEGAAQAEDQCDAAARGATAGARDGRGVRRGARGHARCCCCGKPLRRWHDGSSPQSRRIRECCSRHARCRGGSCRRCCRATAATSVSTTSPRC